MRRLIPLTLPFALAFALLATPARAQTTSPIPAEGSVVVVKLDGSIDGTQSGYLLDTLEEAETKGSTLVIQLDSAGTLDQDAIALAERVHDATVPVIAWVGPAPAQAKGAALLLLYAASVGAVAPGVGVGPLEPLDLVDARNEGFPTGAELEDLVTGWVTERGRPAPVGFPTEPVPAQDALDGNIAQVTAVSVTGLLREVDGLTVGTAGGEVTLRTAIARAEGETPVDVRFTSPGPWDRVLHAAASPAAIYVLLVLGLAGLAFELTQPGFGFAGFAGLGMLALAVYGLTVVPF